MTFAATCGVVLVGEVKNEDEEGEGEDEEGGEGRRGSESGRRVDRSRSGGGAVGGFRAYGPDGLPSVAIGKADQGRDVGSGCDPVDGGGG